MMVDIKKELKSLAEAKYQKFCSKLTPNVVNILGVRLPHLRKIAKRIAKDGYADFFNKNDHEFFELTMLEGMIIGYLPSDEQRKFVEKFIPKINNWAVCDSFCSGLKNFKNDYSLNFLEKYFNSENEFELRFAFVILLNYFIESDYKYVINKIAKFNNEQYYAKMAVAWCLSYCIIKNYNRCLDDIKRLKFNSWVLKKGITKAIESLKLSNNQKEELKRVRADLSE